MQLLKKIENINSYLMFGEFMITISKQNITLYNNETIEMLNRLLIDRYSKILYIDKSSIYIQNQNKILEVDYNLKQKALFGIDIPKMWMLHYVSPNNILIKQEIEREKNHFFILKYDFKKQNIFWKFKCDNYKFSFYNSNYIIIDKDNSKKIQCIDINSGANIWEFDIKSSLEKYSQYDKGINQIFSKPIIFNKTLIIQLQNYNNNLRYLVGYDIKSGKIKWFKQGYNNFELYKNKLYNIEFQGNIRILNPETGEIIKEINLQNEFKRMNINCEHRFNVSNTYIYFKHAIKGKVGILNLKKLEIEEVILLPDNNTMSTEEYPIVNRSRIYVRSAPQNNLFIFQRD